MQAVGLTGVNRIRHIARMNDTAPSNHMLFDRARLRTRRAKYAPVAPVFFDQFMADEVCDRLSMIKRTFQTTLLTSAAPALVHQLADTSPSTNIFTMDTCAERLTNALHPAVIGDEEALPFANESLGCIISLLSLQFVNDLPGALIQMRRVLQPDGLFIGAMLGGESLRELREVFIQAESELCAGVAPRVAPFTDVRDGGALLQRAGFALPVADSDKVTVRYGSMLELIRDLRHLGWANALIEHAPGLMRRDVIARAANLYEERFADEDGRLRATFQMVWLTGWAPHESQQRPLKPGSAKMRLADALDTAETVIKPSSEEND